MASKFLVQIIEKKTGAVVRWAPGLEVERQFEDEICERVAAKGIGLARTTAHVVADIREAIEELFHDLKSDIKP